MSDSGVDASSSSSTTVSSSVSPLGSAPAVSAPSRLSLFLDRAGLQGFPWVSAIVLYTISWGWLFIAAVFFWRYDWCPFLKTCEDVSKQGFAPWLKYFVGFHDLIGVAVMRVSIFGCFFLAAVFLFGILRQQGLFSLREIRLIVLLFLVLPFNTTRVASMVFHYTTGYFLFFAGWYLLARSKSLNGRVMAASAFFVSFQFHSLLSFYLLPLLHYFYLAKVKTFAELSRWTRSNIVLIILPAVYWILRKNFWAGASSYHDVTVGRLANSAPFLALLILVSVGTAYSFVSSKRGNFAKRFGFSLLAICLGLLPYVLIGRYSVDLNRILTYLTVFLGRSDHYSRDQTLQPLGVSMFLVSLLGLGFRGADTLRKVMIRSIISFSVVFNLAFGFEYIVDFQKQEQIVRELKIAGVVALDGEFQFIDQTSLLNARGRTYRDNEWQGLLRLAYGEDSARRAGNRFSIICTDNQRSRLVLIQGPETHWQALKNWVRDRDMGFKVTVDDTPGACKPEMVTAERVSGAIPILFYFMGAKN